MTLKKNILLITPTSPNVAGVTKWLCSNLGIERIAWYLKARNHYAETYDTNLYKADGSGPSLEEKFKEKAWDIIGFSVLEESLCEDIDNMILAHRICPSALIVAGGQEAQFNYQTILDKSPARIVVLGEGEKPLLNIANGVPFEAIPGIVMKNAANSLTREEFKEATELIGYEEIPYERYWDYYIRLYTSNGQKITPEISQRIHTVRLYTRNHCPQKCKFCSSTCFLPQASSKKSVPIVDIMGEDLINLLKRIIKAHPRVETFYFTSDNFCSNKGKLKEFCKMLIREKLKVSFISFARIDNFDEETVILLKEAGFRTFNIGVESYDQATLDSYGKKYKVEIIDRNLRLLKQYGMKPSPGFVLCAPEANLDQVETTARFILDQLENDISYAGFQLAVQPLKGSEFAEEYEEFESEIRPIPGTGISIKKDHFIKCIDPEVRELQYRFIYRWADAMEKIEAEGKIQGGHLNPQLISKTKIEFIIKIIEEIKSERGKSNRFEYSQMSTKERRAIWMKLQKYSYGLSA